MTFEKEYEKCKVKFWEDGIVIVYYDTIEYCVDCGKRIWKSKGITLRDSNGIYATVCDCCYSNYRGTMWYERSWA